MKGTLLKLALASALLLPSAEASAQLDLGRLLSAGTKTIQAFTISDSQMAQYVKATVEKMDNENSVAAANDPYTVRLLKITQGMTSADGIPLNFKVYKTQEVNAFACPDGSVRVYTGLMDLMDDSEVLGVVGHEIGHVAKHHSKKAMKQQLMNGALFDVLASTNGTVAALTDSQLGTLAQSFLSAKYSRKKENEADDAGYELLVKTAKHPWAIAMEGEQMQQFEGS
ncbi:MAG: M48 family metalloprotease, partial [Muribaculaceae bacterium]|nr:M48 family metalloprotease [Muribaculaceae bacterium]